jgi:hypothetical protein
MNLCWTVTGCCLHSCYSTILQNLQGCNFSAVCLLKNCSFIFMSQIMGKSKFWKYCYGFLIVTNSTILQEILENSLRAHSPEPTQHQWNCMSLIHDLCMTVNSWINVEGQLIQLMSAMWCVDKIMHSTTFYWPGL